MNIAGVQSKAGSNIPFLPVILLKRRGGDGKPRQEERLVTLQQKAHVRGFFIQ